MLLEPGTHVRVTSYRVHPNTKQPASMRGKEGKIHELITNRYYVVKFFDGTQPAWFTEDELEVIPKE